MAWKKTLCEHHRGHARGRASRAPPCWGRPHKSPRPASWSPSPTTRVRRTTAYVHRPAWPPCPRTNLATGQKARHAGPCSMHLIPGIRYASARFARVHGMISLRLMPRCTSRACARQPQHANMACCQEAHHAAFHDIPMLACDRRQGEAFPHTMQHACVARSRPARRRTHPAHIARGSRAA